MLDIMECTRQISKDNGSPCQQQGRFVVHGENI